MPKRRSKRTKSTTSTTAVPPDINSAASAEAEDSVDEDMGRSNNSSAKKKIKNMNAEQLFDELLASEDDALVSTQEEISDFIETHLKLNPLTDVRVLVLLWKLKATSKPAQISKKEWLAGCENLSVTSIEQLKALVPSLDTGSLETGQFRDFYKFCFQFSLEGTHKTLDKDLAVGLLKLILEEDDKNKQQVALDRVQTFRAFLETTEDYQRFTLDQWLSFWDFSQECPDLSNYDEATSAWPVMIDDYVEYMEELEKKGGK